MNISYPSVAATAQRMITRPLWALLVAFSFALAGGGGGGGGDTNPNVTQPVGGSPPAQCDPANPATAGECGTVFIGLTDADGDFLTYGVVVESLMLEKANGTTVETLPLSTEVDFVELANLTEFLTAATVPPGTYVSGSITLNYDNADVQVEVGDAAVPADMQDPDGLPLGSYTLKIMLDNVDRLVVTRGRTSLLTMDFDLAASHSIEDLTTNPVVVTAEPFLLAELVPVDEKDIRVRGPLVSVDEDASTYDIKIRPFHRRDGDFGQLSVHTDDETTYEIDGVGFSGAEGLAQMATLAEGTATVAFGTVQVAAREFHAQIVHAGSSVPGIDFDVVKGNVVARDGNTLTVRGAKRILRDGAVDFREDITVLIGPDTGVAKTGHPDEAVDSSDISIGQNILAFGEVSDDITLDATRGRIRMNLTHLSGTVNTALPGFLEIDLQAIDRRRVSIFNFTGTGVIEAEDAEPTAYEVETGNLSNIALLPGTPVGVWGFPPAFMEAPPDFSGRTIADFIDRRAHLGIGWGAEGTLEPFLMMDLEGLVPNVEPSDVRHHIKIGPVLIDLTELDPPVTIVPAEADRTRFAIKLPDAVLMFYNWDDFIEELNERLDGSTAARSMHAIGGYDRQSNTLTAYKVSIHLL